MNEKLRLSVWSALLIGAIMFGLFNFRAIIDVFLGGSNQNERITRNLHWKTATGEVRRATFNIPKGYYTPGAQNVDGGSITLDVMYPSKALVNWEVDKPINPNKVHILIEQGHSQNSMQTSGDRFKAALDDGSLAAQTHQEFVGKQDGLTILRMVGDNDPSRVSYLFHDSERGHWVSSQPKQGHTFREAEALLNNQAVSIFYSYREALETNPITMHHWVMAFVENLQINNPSIHSKEK